MKILIVNTRHFYGGGDSTYSFNLAQLLRNKGHKIAFFALQDERNLPDPNADLFVSHIDFRELNRKRGIRSYLKVAGRAIYCREARRKFRQLLDRFEPDMVHLQNIHGHLTPSVILEARRQGISVVWTLHDYKLVCPNSHFLVDQKGEICERCEKGKYYNALRQRCKKGSLGASAMAALEAYAHRAMRIRHRVNRFLTPSLFSKSKMIANGLPEEKVTHHPLVLIDELFQENGDDRGYLLFLGKLEAIKGIYPLLEAARQVPQVPLRLAGQVEEPLASRLPDLLPSNATYVGLLSGEELRQLRAGARALVLPSIWYENQPFAILEAFAAGKPVIAADLGGMSELVKDGRGLLVPPRDVSRLAQAMAWMVENPEPAREMGMKAQIYARQNHSEKIHYEQLMKIYQEVLEGERLTKACSPESSQG